MKQNPSNEPVAERIEIGNEFAQVVIRKVYTRNGARIEISSPRLGYAIQLDALALESLTWQEIGLFSKLLETPFGPEAKEESVQ